MDIGHLLGSSSIEGVWAEEKGLLSGNCVFREISK